MLSTKGLSELPLTEDLPGPRGPLAIFSLGPRVVSHQLLGFHLGTSRGQQNLGRQDLGKDLRLQTTTRCLALSSLCCVHSVVWETSGRIVSNRFELPLPPPNMFYLALVCLLQSNKNPILQGHWEN